MLRKSQKQRFSPSFEASMNFLSNTVSFTQISEMLKADKSILLALVHSQDNNPTTLQSLRHELVKAVETNHSLLLENIRLRSQLKSP